MTEKLGITPPEMIFGNNKVTIEYLGNQKQAQTVGGADDEKNKVEDGFKITFDAFNALDLVDKTGEQMLKVAYSAAWQKQR